MVWASHGVHIHVGLLALYNLPIPHAHFPQRLYSVGKRMIHKRIGTMNTVQTKCKRGRHVVFQSGKQHDSS